MLKLNNVKYICIKFVKKLICYYFTKDSKKKYFSTLNYRRQFMENIMQINSISKNSFGLKPDSNTKYLLYQMENNDLDTIPIINLMNGLHVGKSLNTKFLDNGSIRMDIYDKGEHFKSLIKPDDGLFVNSDTFRCDETLLLYKKLLRALHIARGNRTNAQVIMDRINYNLSDK